MSKSNTRNIITTLSLTFVMLLFSTTLFSQNDSIKKKKKTFKPFLDTSKKADGIQIAIPDKINPLFDLNRKPAPALKSIEYYLNLNPSNAPKKTPNFLSPRNTVDSDVLVKRNFNGQDTSNPKLKSDGSLGRIESSTKFVRIEFRDHGLVDGDRVRIFLNETVVNSNIMLKGRSAFIDLNLRKGYNRIDFQALNQGSVGPNTAQFFVYDDKGNLVKAQAWNISKGQTATLSVIRY